MTKWIVAASAGLLVLTMIAGLCRPAAPMSPAATETWELRRQQIASIDDAEELWSAACGDDVDAVRCAAIDKLAVTPPAWLDERIAGRYPSEPSAGVRDAMVGALRSRDALLAARETEDDPDVVNAIDACLHARDE